MKPIGPFALTVGTTTTIPGDKLTGTYVITNESPYTLQVSAGQAKWIPAWTVDRFDVGINSNFGGSIAVVPFDLTNATDPPSTYCIADVYDWGEPIPGIYPAALNRQTSIGGGTVSVGVANSLVNITSPVQTQIVDAVPSGGAPYTTDSVQIYNDGQVVLNLLHRGVEITGFSIIPGNGAGNRLSWNFGQSQKDTLGTIEGDLLLFGNTLAVLMSIINGAITMSVQPTLQAGVGFGPGNALGSITQIKGFIGTTGAAGPPSSVTLLHGCNTTPSVILILPFGAAGPIMSYDSVTATQVTVRSSNTVNQVFNGLAIVF